jgi:hypothetical protein
MFTWFSLVRQGSEVVPKAHTDAVQTREHIGSPPVGREMTDNECRCRIRETSTARLRVLDGPAPVPVDVTYSVHGNTVVLRTAREIRSGLLGQGRTALLEIVHGTRETRTSWRVLVTGSCEPTSSDVQDPAATDGPDDTLELQIRFLEGRHGVAEALPPGSVVPPPRRTPD